MTEQEILTKARRLIDTFGWTQGVMYDGSGGYCMAGAVNMVVTGRSSSTLPVETGRALEALMEAGAQPSPITWNDTPGRTREEVLAVFDAAIAKLNADD